MRLVLGAVLALVLAAPAAAQTSVGTPVVGGGSFNTAPILEPGRSGTRSCPRSTSTTASSSKPGSSCTSRPRPTSTSPRSTRWGCCTLTEHPHADAGERPQLQPAGGPQVRAADRAATTASWRSRARSSGRIRTTAPGGPGPRRASTTSRCTRPTRGPLPAAALGDPVHVHRDDQRAGAAEHHRYADADRDAFRDRDAGGARGGRQRRPAALRRGRVRRRRDPDRRGRRDRPPAAPSLSGFELLQKCSEAAGARRTME